MRPSEIAAGVGVVCLLLALLTWLFVRGIATDGIVRVNSILPPSARGWARAVLFLLTKCRRARPDSTPKIAYTYLP
jgi:hypothetical protein